MLPEQSLQLHHSTQPFFPTHRSNTLPSPVSPRLPFYWITPNYTETFNFSQLKTKLLARFLLPSTAPFCCLFFFFLQQTLKTLIYFYCPLFLSSHSFSETTPSLGFQYTILSRFYLYVSSCHFLEPLRRSLGSSAPSKPPLLVLSTEPRGSVFQLLVSPTPTVSAMSYGLIV